MIELTMNGAQHRVDVPEDTPLLWVLREDLGMTGTKYGCGISACGACSVHIDGVATRACVVSVSSLANRSITTIEGLSEARNHPVQTAWIEEQVPQCGYCQSGMIMAAAALLESNPSPTGDEIAEDQGIDPVEFRRRLLRNSPRELALVERVAEMADWGSTPAPGRARGFAFAERSNSRSAGVAEISLDDASGRIRVHQFWVAVDCGIVVQPDIVIAQVEGAITQGVSSVLYERISIREGRVEQSNFHDYHVLSMAEAFPINVELIRNEHRPTGVGEAGLPVTGGAIGNAFAKLTGKRLRHLPFSPDRVRAALEADV